jgi:hypothetical protein
MSVKTYSYKTDKNKSLSAHFKVKEFRCKDGNDKILINSDLITVLEKLFDKLDCDTMNVQSGYRTNTHSAKVGGYAGDQHTQGNAADIWCKKNGKKMDATEICCALEELNHQGGVGYISKTNVHVDVRGKKVWFDETRNERTTESWYKYFGIAKPEDKPKAVKYKVTCLSTWIRKANAKGGLLEIYTRGKIVEVVGTSGRYSKIKYGKKGLEYAFIPTEYIKKA